jgi:hypothetical protein
MKQPALDSEEAVRFWKPVFDEVLRKIKARGWLDVTALGFIANQDGPTEDISALAQKLWPDAVWALMAHNMTRNWRSGANP